MSLRDEWLADPEPLTFAEWLRRRTVPPTLLTLQPPAVNRAERVKVERKQAERKTYKRKSRANPNGRELVHGSTQGWRRHRASGEDPCAECVAGHDAEKARRAADKRAKRRQAGLRERGPARCGTPYMARKHRERGEDVCDPCKKAERDEWRKRQTRSAA